MNVSEAIKNTNNFVITRNGKILAINKVKEELSDIEVKKVQILYGLYADITAVRV